MQRSAVEKEPAQNRQKRSISKYLWGTESAAFQKKARKMRETGRRLLVFRLILMIKVDSTESKVVEVAATLAKFSQVKPIVQRVVQ